MNIFQNNFTELNKKEGRISSTVLKLVTEKFYFTSYVFCTL